MNNSLIPYEALGLTPDRQEIISNFVKYKKELETFESELKSRFIELVESEVIPTNSIDLGGVILSYKRSYTQNKVDTDALKEAGLYSKYTKETTVKASASLKIKKED